jgi:hypothetical protein
LLAILLVALLFHGAQSFLRPKRGVLAVLFLLPILKTAGSSGFLVRFALADVFLAIALAGTLVALRRGRAGPWRSLRVPQQVLVSLLAFLPIVVLSFFASESIERSFVETTAYAVNVLLAALVVFHLRTREDILHAFRVWEAALVVAVIFGVVGLGLLFSGNFDTALTEGPKLASTFKKSGQLSAYLLPSIAILWFNLTHRSTTRRARVLRASLLVVLFVCLVGTGSRTGLALGAATIVILFGGRWLSTCLRRPVPALAWAALALALLVPVGRAASAALPFSFQRALSIASWES